ncbi:MAG: hypothetical protein ACK56F_08425 [bacterium]
MCLASVVALFRETISLLFEALWARACYSFLLAWSSSLLPARMSRPLPLRSWLAVRSTLG